MAVATLDIRAEHNTCYCQGNWTLHDLAGVEKFLTKRFSLRGDTITLDGKQVTALDCSGAWLLKLLALHLQSQGYHVKFTRFPRTGQALFAFLNKKVPTALEAIAVPERHGLFNQLGRATHAIYQEAHLFLAFIGETVLTFLSYLRHPQRIRWRYCFNALQKVGIHALPIIALLIFLIGVVLTYQAGLQLKLYGANIFIVDLSGVAVFREFAPLITAIILAGRTASAFTAEIGTMKVREEIDALRTLGLPPHDHLVAPKVLALLIAFPLLVVWADIFGLFGCMMMSNMMLGISYYEFLHRLPKVIELMTFLIGQIKAPFFALIIALVGCFQGFQVAFSAGSVGQQTTRSVVQAIFLIIVADAIFSVIFSWLGI